MAITYKPLNFERSKREGLSLRLALEETVDVAGNRSTLTYWIEYLNSGEAFKESCKAEFEVNSEKDTRTFQTNFKKTIDKWEKIDYKDTTSAVVNHEATGRGTYSIAVKFKTDPLGFEIVSQVKYYRTVATATATGTLTPIDQTPPMVSRKALTVNRYGKKAMLSIKCSHVKYEMTISLLLKGLTVTQASLRNGFRNEPIEGATLSSYWRENDYTSSLPNNAQAEYIIKPIEKTFDSTVELWYRLDSHLDSGYSYPYVLTVTATNGKSVTYNGVLAVPQKVTGIAFNDEALTLAVGESATPEYNISPGNAEVKTGSFESSDSDIATVSADGEITAVSEGNCIVTVTSDDHGTAGTDNFTSDIQVSVVADSDGFPQLSTMDYLGVVEISRLSTACTWLADKLGKTAEMQDVVCQGRAHPVTDIRTIMEAIEANVAVLSDRSADEITKYNDDWYGLVNGWVNSLNELYEQNKEG